MHVGNVILTEASRSKKENFCQVCGKRNATQVIFSERGDTILCCDQTHCTSKAKHKKIKPKQN